MVRIFAVTRTYGPAFDPALPLEQREDWRGHGDFMNGIHAEGFVILGGPLEGTPDNDADQGSTAHQADCSLDAAPGIPRLTGQAEASWPQLLAVQRVR